VSTAANTRSPAPVAGAGAVRAATTQRGRCQPIRHRNPLAHKGLRPCCGVLGRRT
jgi:hypothetical protein